ncbi:cytochrome c [Ostreiculturibacter nitratireducens]|uniref:c-type cytochrome n=1 Tax=Ostreiculturibacter nitratireducens TaxID=3075226 RepID=UPI0031B5CBCF
MRNWTASVIVAFTLASAAYSQEPGNPEAGKALAQEHCSNCHNIAEGGAFKLYPPSFAAIGTYMGTDMIRMRIMIPNVHTIMPRFYEIMTAANLNDLTAYIVSLEK